VKAKPVFHEKRLVEGGERIGIAELKVWDVPRSASYPAGRKYSLFFVIDGTVLVGFDNHTPKGPHLHLAGVELPYAFRTVEQLIEDFWEIVRKAGFEP
jgi:hypothetical protein